MNADTTRDDAAAGEVEAGEAAEAAETPEAADPAVQPDEPQAAPQSEAKPMEVDPQEQIRRLEAERLRVAADFANYQKRVIRDKAKWTEDAVRDALSSLLPVLDNLEHAVASFDGEVKDPQVYRQGVELVQSELLRVLSLYRLEAIAPAEGASFDPDLHQAISVMPADDVEEEVVAMMARTGYKLGDTVLRAAQVVVKKPAG